MDESKYKKIIYLLCYSVEELAKALWDETDNTRVAVGCKDSLDFVKMVKEQLE